MRRISRSAAASGLVTTPMRAGPWRERPLALGVEEPCSCQPRLERLELGVELAPPGRLQAIHVELVVAALGVDAHVAMGDDLVALAREPALRLRLRLST